MTTPKYMRNDMEQEAREWTAKDQLRLDADWIETSVEYWDEGNPVSEECRVRLMEIAGRLRSMAGPPRDLRVNDEPYDKGLPQ